MPKTYTAIENWIVTNVRLTPSNSVEQTYDRLDGQTGNLPFINVPQDLTNPAHFVEEALIWDFALHLAGCENVLDVGCGDGWPGLRLASHFPKLVAVDASTRRVATAQANARRLGLKNVSIKQMSALELDFPDGSFDGVVVASVVEQTTDPYQALREIFRVLKPGGRLRLFFEPGDNRIRGVSERVFISETEDSLGYHYVLKHHRPPWERNYLIKFPATPELKEHFRRLQSLIERLGSNPIQAPEIGLEFLIQNQAHILGGSWYEIELFTSETMRETLEEIGFEQVNIVYSAGTFANRFFPLIKDYGFSASQLAACCRALAEISKGVSAPDGSGEPIVAVRPK